MKVAVLSKSFAKASTQPVALLEKAGIEVLQRPNDDPGNEARVAELIGDCHGAIVSAQDQIGSLVFERCAQLRVIADHAVGFDRIDMEGAKARGIVVKTCPGNYESVADLAWLFILATSRKLLPAVQSVKDGQWSPPAFSGTEVLGKSIGIIGYGQIGKAVIKRAQGRYTNCIRQAFWTGNVYGWQVMATDPLIPGYLRARIRVRLSGRIQSERAAGMDLEKNYG